MITDTKVVKVLQPKHAIRAFMIDGAPICCYSIRFLVDSRTKSFFAANSLGIMRLRVLANRVSVCPEFWPMALMNVVSLGQGGIRVSSRASVLKYFWSINMVKTVVTIVDDHHHVLSPIHEVDHAHTLMMMMMMIPSLVFSMCLWYLREALLELFDSVRRPSASASFHSTISPLSTWMHIRIFLFREILVLTLSLHRTHSMMHSMLLKTVLRRF